MSVIVSVTSTWLFVSVRLFVRPIEAPRLRILWFGGHIRAGETVTCAGSVAWSTPSASWSAVSFVRQDMTTEPVSLARAPGAAASMAIAAPPSAALIRFRSDIGVGFLRINGVIIYPTKCYWAEKPESKLLVA